MSKIEPGLFMRGDAHHPWVWRDSQALLEGSMDIAPSIRVAQMDELGLFDIAFLTDESASQVQRFHTDRECVLGGKDAVV